MFIFQLLILFFSVIVHECAHGLMAEKSGDPTARLMGRITLNPIPHIDPFGTIILPLLLAIMRSPFLIGWAKPVPVNPYNFRNYKIDTIKVSVAGPLSNILLSITFAAFFHILKNVPSTIFLLQLLSFGVYINLLLAFFNLIPFPPLDGSKILFSLLPYNISFRFQRILNLSPFLILIVIWLIWPVVSAFVNIFYRLLLF